MILYYSIISLSDAHISYKNCDLLFTDTDSLCFHIKGFDVFELMKNNKSYFDLSNYDKNHELYDKTNNKVIGKFKNDFSQPHYPCGSHHK